LAQPFGDDSLRFRYLGLAAAVRVNFTAVEIAPTRAGGHRPRICPRRVWGHRRVTVRCGRAIRLQVFTFAGRGDGASCFPLVICIFIHYQPMVRCVEHCCHWGCFPTFPVRCSWSVCPPAAPRAGLTVCPAASGWPARLLRPAVSLLPVPCWPCLLPVWPGRHIGPMTSGLWPGRDFRQFH
jgi:hypothetical protein